MSIHKWRLAIWHIQPQCIITVAVRCFRRGFSIIILRTPITAQCQQCRGFPLQTIPALAMHLHHAKRCFPAGLSAERAQVLGSSVQAALGA